METYQLNKSGAQVDRDLAEGLDNQPKEDLVWDDLKAPASTIRQGATLKPDYSTAENGLLFPQNDDTEIAYIVLQFPHERKNGSDIKPHVHFIQDSADIPVFKIDYRWYKNGDTVPATWTTLSTSSLVFTYTSGNMLQIAAFPDIDGSSVDTVSSILDIKLYRDDNVVTGDVLLKEFDVHYQIDQMGSRTEYVK